MTNKNHLDACDCIQCKDSTKEMTAEEIAALGFYTLGSGKNSLLNAIGNPQQPASSRKRRVPYRRPKS